ncbi:hypothetical protein BF49_7288 [Bradyrhizobium sp.]|nr:hypothetical protein BF49_7288 [Bradyrhizobium sp.]
MARERVIASEAGIARSHFFPDRALHRMAAFHRAGHRAIAFAVFNT